jgi:hypothetical protein
MYTGPDDDAGFGAACAGPPPWIVEAGGGGGPICATMFWPPALLSPCIGAGWYRGLEF